MNRSAKKAMPVRLLYAVRDLVNRPLFEALHRYCSGAVLDVGGWDFFRTALRRKVSFNSWTVLEVAAREVTEIADDRVSVVVGDGCRMDFKDDRYDTVVNVQVLEHVFEPNVMIREMCRVLKPGGYLIMLVPQTATIHMAPNHFYNFTRFWIEEALRCNKMETVELRPLGGIWSSMASHLVYFVFQSIRFPGMSTDAHKRNALFYVLYPAMLLFALVALPATLILSLGDLTEEPNNHLVVAKKAPLLRVKRDR